MAQPTSQGIAAMASSLVRVHFNCAIAPDEARALARLARQYGTRAGALRVLLRDDRVKELRIAELRASEAQSREWVARIHRDEVYTRESAKTQRQNSRHHHATQLDSTRAMRDSLAEHLKSVAELHKNVAKIVEFRIEHGMEGADHASVMREIHAMVPAFGLALPTDGTPPIEDTTTQRTPKA